MIKSLAVAASLASTLSLSACPEPTEVPDKGNNKGGQTIVVGVDMDSAATGYNWQIYQDGKPKSGSSSGPHQEVLSGVQFGASIKAQNMSQKGNISCYYKIGLMGSKNSVTSAGPGKSCSAVWTAPRS